jgi:O-methyltransferase involved in polyketide biosynthesis
MSEKRSLTLSSVAETLLIPLYNRAMESKRPEAMLKDEKAMELVNQMGLDLSPARHVRMTELLKVMRIMFTREFDRYACDFLKRNPEAVVVHIGCGLDTRYERVDNDQVEWYDLDLPEVIELRRKLIGGEGERHQFLASSVLENAWLEVVDTNQPRPFLFLAEGVFMYFTEAQVKALVLRLKEHFPSAELVFDAYSPFTRWAHTLRVTRKRIGAPLHWALKRRRDLEPWGDASPSDTGICLLDERFPFQFPEVNLHRTLRVCLFPSLVANGSFPLPTLGG